MSKGIDYGMGLTNIDQQTGIRFGVIHANDVCQAWSDSSEPDYGSPHCPHCGDEACETSEDHGAETPDREDYERDRGACGDYACDDCKRLFDGDSAFADEAHAFTLDDGEYCATQGGDDCDIFVLRSPYYTRAQFCSPCAPGACYLRHPCEDGERAYCFGQDWFDSENPCPYPIWRVADDVLVYSPPAESDSAE